MNWYICLKKKGTFRKLAIDINYQTNNHSKRYIPTYTDCMFPGD